MAHESLRELHPTNQALTINVGVAAAYPESPIDKSPFTDGIVPGSGMPYRYRVYQTNSGTGRQPGFVDLDFEKNLTEEILLHRIYAELTVVPIIASLNHHFWSFVGHFFPALLPKPLYDNNIKRAQRHIQKAIELLPQRARRELHPFAIVKLEVDNVFTPVVALAILEDRLGLHHYCQETQLAMRSVIDAMSALWQKQVEDHASSANGTTTGITAH